MNQYFKIVAVLLILLATFFTISKLHIEYQRTENIMNKFRQTDISLVSALLYLDIPSLSETDAMHTFYRLIAFPLQGVCRSMKRVGGHWMNIAVDGDKYVCMDRMNSNTPCNIYTFGISNDWSFEDYMDGQHGCSIWAYDHTVDFPTKRGKNINFFKLGLGIGQDLDTLANHIQTNGHRNTVIEYLKIDIEEAELSAGGLQEWISSGVMENVNQLGIELHLQSLHNGPRFKWLLKLMQDLYRLNFRLISYQPNLVVGPATDTYYNYMEVVLMKDNVWVDE